MKLSVRFSSTRPEKHLIARAITCCMLLVLPSCGIPDLRQALPGPNLTANYKADFPGAASLENSSQVSIEDFFNDPFLTRLICQALAGNQDLRIMYEDVQIARNVILGRSGAYLPSVGLGLAAGLERNSRFTPLGAAEDQLEYLPGKHFPGLPGNFLVTAQFNWQVDIWRQLRNSRDSAVQRFLATNEGRNFAITRLVAEIAENYYMLLALDARLANLDSIIALQQDSLNRARALVKFARSTELGPQRFIAEIRGNESQKLIVRQEIIEVENRINFLVGRYPQPVERMSGANFIALNLPALSIGVPAQLLQYRPDIRQAERDLVAAGLDVKVARAQFFPRLDISGPPGPLGPNAPIGWQAFNPKYLFWTPQSLLVSVAGDLMTPLINKRAIKADYKNANARQLQAVYNYQRVILNAFTEVVTRVSKVQNYSQSIEIKKQQVQALQKSVEIAMLLFKAAFRQAEEKTGRPVNYMDVLFAQRDLFEAIMILIETKQQQLSAIVNVYQALGGGLWGCGGFMGCTDIGPKPPHPGPSLVRPLPGDNEPSRTEERPAPREQPEELPAPRKQPEQRPVPNSTPPGRLPEPGKLPT